MKTLLLKKLKSYFRFNETLPEGLHDEFTQSEIDELGGDDWLAEMGLTQVEVTE